MFSFVRTVAALVVLSLASPPLVWAGEQKDVTLFNEAGLSIDVFWVHPQNGGIHKMTADGEVIKDGLSIPLKSFAGHEFEVHEVPNPSTGECDTTDSKTCRRAIFQVTPYDDQVIFITPNFEAVIEDSNTKAQAAAGDLVQDCHIQAKRKTPADPSAEDLQKSMLGLVQCVEDKVARNLIKSNEEVAFQASVRKDMAAKLENYTCDDPDHPTSAPVRDEIWKTAKDGHPRTVHVMHDRPASKIHVVEHFIDPEECDAMEHAAEPILHRATVADGSGGSKYSEARKAMQAGINVKWEKEADGDPIARLSRRVYDYANHVLGLGLEHHGQEDLMSIQYFGRGYNDTEPDRYTPHCDGDCTGLKHKHGTRMATMVMYCKIPQHGGHTNFRNAGIHIQPKMGNAIFFAYIDPDTKVMDTGFTEHSGCPVFEGEKKIVTQWIRYGVDKENPWDSFNTLGIKKSEENDY
ncbi:Probable prolyl 4-hydroxylase [Seminavis robusta]|uniref:Probable prolyl 4-hydroxylase n=1 Tax=Seminavis robusta TaxID=568900 RepID=A0A9N8EDR5_9STRA|nr:Probable prolyl 4-hydroxylase [Seminavis robusta]|eukprot:Sro927_g221170.1 Probable prolyl 4-hydroxylase (463) ;mRNA; r:30543-32725